VLLLLAGGAWSAKEAREAARTGRFEFRHPWQDKRGVRSHAFEEVEARRVSAGLYGVAVLCGVWALRVVAPSGGFPGRLGRGHTRLSLAALAAGLAILFPPWRVASSWPILTLYFLPVSTMVAVAATHGVAEPRRKDLRGKLVAGLAMAAFVLCAVGGGDAWATGGLGLVTSLVLYAHVEKIRARPATSGA
jgi:hypothetical protein